VLLLKILTEATAWFYLVPMAAAAVQAMELMELTEAQVVMEGFQAAVRAAAVRAQERAMVELEVQAALVLFIYGW